MAKTEWKRHKHTPLNTHAHKENVVFLRTLADNDSAPGLVTDTKTRKLQISTLEARESGILLWPKHRVLALTVSSHVALHCHSAGWKIALTLLLDYYKNIIARSQKLFAKPVRPQSNWEYGVHLCLQNYLFVAFTAPGLWDTFLLALCIKNLKCLFDCFVMMSRL